MTKQRILQLHELHQAWWNMVLHDFEIRGFVNLISSPFQIRQTGIDPYILIFNSHITITYTRALARELLVWERLRG